MPSPRGLFRPRAARRSCAHTKGKAGVRADPGKVGSRAFANCAELRLLLFEGSPASVASDAFEGCGSLTIIAPKGSDELKAAAENQNVEYIER